MREVCTVHRCSRELNTNCWSEQQYTALMAEREDYYLIEGICPKCRVREADPEYPQVSYPEEAIRFYQNMALPSRPLTDYHKDRISESGY
jgi:hypothetical protein